MIHFQFLGPSYPVQRGKDPTDAHRNTPTIKESLHKPQETANSLALLLADTDGAATATSGLGVLTTDTQAPVVTETAVGADLLEALKILTELAVQTVGNNLRILAVGNVALSVQEPAGDLVLGRGLEDGDDTLELFGGEFTSTVRILSALLLDFVILWAISAVSPTMSPLAQRRDFTPIVNQHNHQYLIYPSVRRPYSTIHCRVA